MGGGTPGTRMTIATGDLPPVSSIHTYESGLQIGQSYGGGYLAGKINVSGTQYYLIVAPKSTGEASGLQYGPQGTVTGATSTINGPANTTNLAARGAEYQAANFCENLNTGGYTDWYLPSLNELEVCYYFLKPGTTLNTTFYGSNPNAVSPQPISTNYTAGSPAQTSVTNFRTGGSQAFVATTYWSSTETASDYAYTPNMDDGLQYNVSKTFARNVRAVRRVLV